MSLISLMAFNAEHEQMRPAGNDEAPVRYAYVPSAGATVVAQYLPENYRVIATRDAGVVIAGEDRAGWTLEDYVLPRLASGLMFGHEIEHAGAL